MTDFIKVAFPKSNNHTLRPQTSVVTNQNQIPQTLVNTNRNQRPQTSNTTYTHIRICRFNIGGTCTKRTLKDDVGTYCQFQDIKNYHFSEEDKNKNRNVKACRGYCFSPFECVQGLDPWYCFSSGCLCDNTKYGDCSLKNMCCSRHDPDYRLKNQFNKKNMVDENKQIEKKTLVIKFEDFPQLTEPKINLMPSPWLSFSVISEDPNIVYKMIKPPKEIILVLDTTLVSGVATKDATLVSNSEKLELTLEDKVDIIPKKKRNKVKKVTELSEEELLECIYQMENGCKMVEPAEQCEYITDVLSHPKIELSNIELPKEILDIVTEDQDVILSSENFIVSPKKSSSPRIIRISNQIDSFDKKGKNVSIVKDKFTYACNAFDSYQEKLENQRTISNKKMKAYKIDLELSKKSYNELFEVVEKIMEDLKFSDDDDDSVDDIVNKVNKMKSNDSDSDSDSDESDDDDELSRMINAKL